MRLFFTILFLTITQSFSETKSLTWPREFDVSGSKVTIHQPQIDEWQKYSRLIGKAAVVVNDFVLDL